MTVSRGRWGWIASGVESTYCPRSRDDTSSKGKSGAGELGVNNGFAENGRA